MISQLETIEGLAAIDLDDIERSLENRGYRAICGVDEVGCGPLAGPVVAAAVIMPGGVSIDGNGDSKKLTASRREEIFEAIAEAGLVCSVGIMSHEEVDKLNIRRAALMAMRKAIMDLKQAPDFVLVDGNAAIPRLDFPQMSVVGGDGRCPAVAAASIVAKVTRDRIMERYQALYPQFSFAQHKGYGTPDHLRELREHGPCEIHRRSFRPVAELLDQYALF